MEPPPPDGPSLARGLFQQLQSWDSVASVLQQGLVHCQSQQNDDTNASGPVEQQHLTETLFSMDKVPFLSPRGKFDVHLGPVNLLLIDSKQVSTLIPYSNIFRILKMPQRDPVKKNVVAKYLFILCFIDSVRIRRSNALYLVMHFSTNVDQARLQQLDQHLVRCVPTSIPVTRTSPELLSEFGFVSTDTQSYVKCYHKTSDGLLYLLPEGLLFLPSPILFLKRQEIASIEAGRGGSAASRTFDLTVELKSGKVVEFSMLEREELPGISDFVKGFEKLKDTDGGSSAGQQKQQLGDETPAAASDAEASDDESDESFQSQEEDSDDASSEDLSGDAQSEVEDDDEDENGEEDEEDCDDENEDDGDAADEHAKVDAVSNDSEDAVAVGSDDENDTIEQRPASETESESEGKPAVVAEKESKRKATTTTCSPQKLSGLEAHGFFVKRSKVKK